MERPTIIDTQAGQDAEGEGASDHLSPLSELKPPLLLQSCNPASMIREPYPQCAILDVPAKWAASQPRVVLSVKDIDDACTLTEADVETTTPRHQRALRWGRTSVEIYEFLKADGAQLLLCEDESDCDFGGSLNYCIGHCPPGYEEVAAKVHQVLGTEPIECIADTVSIWPGKDEDSRGAYPYLFARMIQECREMGATRLIGICRVDNDALRNHQALGLHRIHDENGIPLTIQMTHYVQATHQEETATFWVLSTDPRSKEYDALLKAVEASPVEFIKIQE